MQIRQMLDRQVGEFAICWEWFTFLTWERFWKGFEKNPGTYLQKAQVPIISSNDLNYKMVDYNQNLKYSIIFFLEELSVVRFVRVAKKWSKIGMYHVKSEICSRTLTITLLYFPPQMIFGAKFFFLSHFFFFCWPTSSDLILFQTFNHNHDLNITIDVGDLFFITRFLL